MLSGYDVVAVALCTFWIGFVIGVILIDTSKEVDILDTPAHIDIVNDRVDAIEKRLDEGLDCKIYIQDIKQPTRTRYVF